MVDVINKAMAFLGGEFQRQGVEVELELPHPFFLSGDPDLLYRAFYNVLINAQQAIQGTGRIVIRGTRLDNGDVELSFQDNGPGFPPDELDKPLDPFYTTKDTGTGLGLPIVQSIVASHGGTLELANAPEGGAVIRLFFPAPPSMEASR